MRAQLFDFIDADPRRVHIPDGRGDERAVQRHALEYERAIQDAGGIDLQLLGIGRNGHIGFNEPGCARTDRTRCVELHPWTREDQSASFGGLERVPRHAITMGVATILDARRLVVMAFGASKRSIVERTLAADDPLDWPATYLQSHTAVTLLADSLAIR
jgi:glucosamine-6-phosphate deaminase